MQSAIVLLIHILQHLDGYWFVRKFLHRLQVKRSELRLRSLEIVADLSAVSFGLVQIGRMILFESFLICFIFLALLFMEQVIHISCNHFGFPRLGFERTFPIHLNAHADAYLYFLSVAAQVSATLLAIYLAAIGVVAGTTYSMASDRLRHFLLQDSVNNAFVKLNVFLFISSMLSLLGLSFGVIPKWTSAVVVTIGSIMSIASVGSIGGRGFLLLDPTAMIGRVNEQIEFWIHNASSQRHDWLTGNYFFEQCRAGAEYQIQFYDDILEVVRNDNASENLRKLAHHFILLLSTYCAHKTVLLTDCGWFRGEPQHSRWTESNSFAASFALNTRQALRPVEATEVLWLEREVSGRLKKVICHKAFHDHLKLQSFLISFSDYAEKLGSTLSVDELCFMVEQVMSTLENYIEIHYSSGSDTPELTRQVLGILELAGIASVNGVVAISTTLKKLQPESVRKLITCCNWASIRQQPNYPRQVKERILAFEHQIDFERKIEGKRITPDWYFLQISAIEWSRFFIGMSGKLITFIESTFCDRAERLLSADRPLLACQLLLRAFECTAKMHQQLDLASAQATEFAKLYVSKDFGNPSMDVEALRNRLNQVNQTMALLYGRAATGIQPEYQSTVLWPDYFGHAFVILAQECFYSLCRGEQQFVGEVFQVLSTIWRSLHDRQDRDIEASSMFVDLLELSGYALLFQELGHGNAFSSIEAHWRQYLLTEIQLRPTSISKQLKQHLLHADVGARGEVRFNWMRTFKEFLRIENLIVGVSGRRNESYESLSPRIRAFLRTHLEFSFSPAEAFYVFSLLTISEFRETSPLWQGNELLEEYIAQSTQNTPEENYE